MSGAFSFVFNTLVSQNTDDKLYLMDALWKKGLFSYLRFPHYGYYYYIHDIIIPYFKDETE